MQEVVSSVQRSVSQDRACLSRSTTPPLCHLRVYTGRRDCSCESRTRYVVPLTLLGSRVRKGEMNVAMWDAPPETRTRALLWLPLI